MNAEINVSKVVLKTDRLILRAWKVSDLDDYYSYAKVDGVGQLAGWNPHKNKEETRQILREFIDNKKTFAIEYQGKVIGSVGIEHYDTKVYPEFDELYAREIGYALSKDYWGQGIMTEAVKEVIRYLFTNTKVDVLTCGCFETNERSKRVQEKCGFGFCKKYVYETVNGDKVNAIGSTLYNPYMFNIKR